MWIIGGRAASRLRPCPAAGRPRSGSMLVVADWKSETERCSEDTIVAWKPIAAGDPDVQRVHPRASGLIEIYIPLSEEPPCEWIEFFEHPSGISIPLSMHPPHIEGDQVYIRPPDHQEADYVQHVQERIKAANAWYEKEVLPRKLARERTADAEAQRLEDARRRIHASGAKRTEPPPGPSVAGSPIASPLTPTPAPLESYDVFICHASEDKSDLVEPLAIKLRGVGLKVWYDKFVLKLGDSLLARIDAGLAQSRFGVVVLSPSFFKKPWPRNELDGLVAKETRDGRKVVLPIWHKVTFDDVSRHSPILAGRLAALSDQGLDEVVRQIQDALGG